MKFMKRANMYQASNYNVTFDPTTIRAVSYKWWTFVAVIEGQVIFNNYRYSVSTSKHQSKVRQLLAQLGIKIDLELPLPKGIMPLDTLQECIDKAEMYLCEEIINEGFKRDARNERAKERREERKAMDRITQNSNARHDYSLRLIDGGAL